jgi:hypothetical protein
VLLAVYAAAMGYMEAVVVVYIRGIVGLLPKDGMPSEAEVMKRIAELPWLLPTEQSREVATIVMIASVAWLAGAAWKPRLGAFLYVFGIWDIAYYAGLWLHLRWPPSLATYDLLFLIPPGPWWYQPVWLPVAISVGFIAAGLRLMRGARGAASSA